MHDKKKFVLKNVPRHYTAADLKDYVESVLDVDVCNVEVQPNIPDRALVELVNPCKDFEQAGVSVIKNRIESRRITFLRTRQEPAAVISGFPPGSQMNESVKTVLDKKLWKGRIVLGFKSFHKLGIAVVYLDSSNDRKWQRIFEHCQSLLFLDKHPIKVAPYYRFFHNYIGQYDNDDSVSGDDGEKKTQETQQKRNKCPKQAWQFKDEGEENEKFEKENTGSSQCQDSFSEFRGRGGFRNRGRGRQRGGGSANNWHGRGRGGRSSPNNEELSSSEDEIESDNLDPEKDGKDDHFYNKRGRGGKRGRGNLSRQEGSGQSNDQSSVGRFSDGEDDVESINSDRVQSENGTQYYNKRGRRPVDGGGWENRNREEHEAGGQFNTHRGRGWGGDERRGGYGQRSRGSRRNRGGLGGAEKLSFEQEFEKRLRHDKEFKEKCGKLLKGTEETSVHVTERCPMSLSQKELISEHFGTFGECLVYYDFEEKTAVLKGPDQIVRDRHIKTVTALKALKEEIITVSSSITSIMQRDKGQELLKVLLSRFQNTKVDICDRCLTVVSRDDAELKKAVEMLQKRVSSKVTVSNKSEISESVLCCIQAILERDSMIHVSWSDDRSNVCVEGIKEDVVWSKTKLIQLVEENSVYENTFEVTGTDAEFLSKFYCDTLTSTLKEVKCTDKLIGTSHIRIKFEGNKQNVNQVMRNLNILKDKLTNVQVKLESEFQKEDLIYVVNILEGAKEKIRYFELEEKCLVKLKFSDPAPYSPDLQKPRLGVGQTATTVLIPGYTPYLSRQNAVYDDIANGDSIGDDDCVSSFLSAAEVFIYTWHGEQVNKLWTNFKKKVIEPYLFLDYFHQGVLDSWPIESQSNINQEAEKMDVLVMTSLDPMTKRPGYMVKGEKNAVEKMKLFIEKEFKEASFKVPKQNMESRSAPMRGTKEFLDYAANSDQIIPSYWGLTQPKNLTLWQRFRKYMSKADASLLNILVDVDTQTNAAIKKLVEESWNPSSVGYHSDALGLRYTQIQVLSIKRVENDELFEKYCLKRKQLFKKMSRAGKVCPDIASLLGSKSGVLTTGLLPDFMKRELYHEINEHYLFHGTKSNVLETLIKHGLDMRVASNSALFGKGVYLAEEFAKSDQYTDYYGDRTMILARAILGNVFLCDSQHATVASSTGEKFKRPPCMRCQKDLCTCPDQQHYDSVMADGRWAFREFVLYDNHICYPEYIIYYKKKAIAL